LVALKRYIFRLSEISNYGKKIRWELEKAHAKIREKSGTVLSRNDAMNTDIHILWPLYNNSQDILHEYFIPKNNSAAFMRELKKHILNEQVNILNVTVREVSQDKTSGLPYATKDVFAFVCLFSQTTTAEGDEHMKIFTQKVIDSAIKYGGTFYLPYKPHYTKDQLLTAYPSIKSWMSIKNLHDRNHLFQSIFYQNLQKLLSAENR
jgi:FAD/FMN-containing dehydrogenase